MKFLQGEVDALSEERSAVLQEATQKSVEAKEASSSATLARHSLAELLQTLERAKNELDLLQQ